MADPFLLDQKEVAVTLKRLEAAVVIWRAMQKDQSKGDSCNESLEYEFHSVESTIKNGIRDVKWSLDDLDETLKLMSENRSHFVASEELQSRRGFLASARQTLADIEFEVTSPTVQAVINQQLAVAKHANDEASCANDEAAEAATQLLRQASADSDEDQVVFSKPGVVSVQTKQHPQQHQPHQQHPQQHQPMASMVSLNLDTVADLIRPRGSGSPGALKSLLNALVRYRCWLFLAALLLFFLILIIMKAVNRTRGLAIDDGVSTTASSTTECAIDNMDSI